MFFCYQSMTALVHQLFQKTSFKEWKGRDRVIAAAASLGCAVAIGASKSPLVVYITFLSLGALTCGVYRAPRKVAPPNEIPAPNPKVEKESEDPKQRWAVFREKMLASTRKLHTEFKEEQGRLKEAKAKREKQKPAPQQPALPVATLIPSPQTSHESSLPKELVDMTAEAASHPEWEIAPNNASEFIQFLKICQRGFSKKSIMLVEKNREAALVFVKNLAWVIHHQKLPEDHPLAKLKIVRLDSTLLRRKDTKKVAEILAALKKDPQMLCFVEEAHLLVGTKASYETWDINSINLVKLALMEEEIQLLGATSLDNFDTYCDPHSEGKKDLDFDRYWRRFDAVSLDAKQCFNRLMLQKEALETHHPEIEIIPGAVAAAVASTEFGPSHQSLLTAAFDLLDLGCSYAVENKKSQVTESDIVQAAYLSWSSQKTDTEKLMGSVQTKTPKLQIEADDGIL